MVFAHGTVQYSGCLNFYFSEHLMDFYGIQVVLKVEGSRTDTKGPCGEIHLSTIIHVYVDSPERP